jgi:phosphopantothenoylcysteine decarboxylase/phosphopantothenate--cysteine ligase
VGFAAETHDLLSHAREKLLAKNLDFIVANDVSRPGIGLDADDNAVTILGRAGQVYDVARASKAEVAEAIVEHVFAAADNAVS